MKHHLIRPIILIVCLAAFQACPAASDKSAHPRFFFAPEDVATMRDRAESTEWLRAMRQAVIDKANHFLNTKTNPYALSGPENGIGTAGRAVQRRVGILALAGYLSGDEIYFQKSTEILLAVVRQFEAGNRDHWRTHLQYSDATQALAIGYDLLYPYLNDAEREEVRAELFEYGHLLYTDKTTWGSPSPGVTSCNHNSVQFGALGLAALALGDQPDWLERATERVRGYLK